jgi:hypothetical protein
MAVWLGEAGGLRLARVAEERVYAEISPADVVPETRRLGLDKAVGSFTTGDLVWIRRVDASGNQSSQSLDFVAPSGWPDNSRHPDGQWFVNSDGLSLRLYRSWQDALQGGYANAVDLTTPSGSYRLSIELGKDDAECLAQTVSWELNTNREVVDITPLGESFQRQMGTLISGSGTVNCLFDSNWRACDDAYESRAESPLYLHRLAMRQQIGSTFQGVFLLKQAGAVPLASMIGSAERKRELFYLCDCVISQVAVALNPTGPITSQINFVTTGPIQLLFSNPGDYLLKEQGVGEKILLESGFGILLDVG